MDPSPGRAGPPEDDSFGSPVSALKVDRVLRLLGLSPVSRVLDLGCGQGEVLVRACEQFGARGIGVDVNPGAIREARRKAAERVPGADLVLHEGDAARFVPDAPADAAVCIGATHIFGGFRPTLRALRALVRPGGLLVVGDLYWKQEPAPEYLAVLGEGREDHFDHAGNVAAGGEEGLLALYAAASSEDDWDHFEGRFWREKLRTALDEPDDARRVEATERVRRWQAAYLRWGRATLGFGLYVFKSAFVPPGG